MPKYMIERNMPGDDALSSDEPAAIAEKSCRAQDEMGPGIQWVERLVTANRLTRYPTP